MRISAGTPLWVHVSFCAQNRLPVTVNTRNCIFYSNLGRSVKTGSQKSPLEGERPCPTSVD